eukprot:scaffold90661_cov53-Phaeocystis_antarctica.AAC.3
MRISAAHLLGDPLRTYYSLLTTHHMLLATHYSVLTTDLLGDPLADGLVRLLRLWRGNVARGQ